MRCRRRSSTTFMHCRETSKMRPVRAARNLADDLNRRVNPRAAAPPGVLEMTWAPDGRATFEFGREIRSGEHHVVWRRIGTHEIFSRP